MAFAIIIAGALGLAGCGVIAVSLDKIAEAITNHAIASNPFHKAHDQEEVS